jgi:hypothetical protein
VYLGFMKTPILHGWDDVSEIFSNGLGFNTNPPTDMTVLYGAYVQGDYEGDAIVLLRHENGDFYEAGGGHCSCNGLEDQWKPEVTSIEALLTQPRIDRYEGLRALLEYLAGEDDRAAEEKQAVEDRARATSRYDRDVI